MVKLLHAQSPDDGATLPVTVDAHGVGVSSVRLFRASSEGSDRALHADITLDLPNAASWGGEERLFEVFVYVLAEDHVAPMNRSTYITSPTDLDNIWDMSSNSSGGRVSRTVLVKTYLHQPEKF